MTLHRAENYMIGDVAIVTSRVAAVLAVRAGLVDYHQRTRGADPEVDAQVAALIGQGLRWQRSARARHGHTSPASAAASSARGMSAADAARSLGVSKRTVLREIAAGRISAERIGIGYVIAHEDVEHYRASAAAGRPDLPGERMPLTSKAILELAAVRSGSGLRGRMEYAAPG
jgi:excisionase family DNA binding protein